MTTDALGRIRWTPELDQVGPTTVTVEVADDPGSRVVQAFTIEVVADDEPPQVQVFPTLNPIQIGNEVTFVVIATDNREIRAVSLTVAGEDVALDRNGTATVRLDLAGDIQAVATAIDGSLIHD